MSTHLDHANIKNNQMEKKIRQFDKIIGDWKRKADGLSQELDQSQKECRNVSAELFRVTNGYNEAFNQVQSSIFKRKLTKKLECFMFETCFKTVQLFWFCCRKTWWWNFSCRRWNGRTQRSRTRSRTSWSRWSFFKEKLAHFTSKNYIWSCKRTI